MAKSYSSLVPLVAHPDTPSETVRRLVAWAGLMGTDYLRFRYVLEADARHVRIPPRVPDSGRADRLWAHTCFEAFVGRGESPGYLELNFSPSGQWAAYRFESYRQGMVPAVMDAAPRLALRPGEKQLELQAEVRLSGASACADGRLRIALSAVVEDREGRLSYWALRHPPGRPDFHHPHGFSLALELSRKQIP
jgi:hypothetical protein